MLHVLMEYPRLGLLPRLLLHWLSSGLDLWLALHLRLALHWRLAPHLWLARLSLRRRLPLKLLRLPLKLLLGRHRLTALELLWLSLKLLGLPLELLRWLALKLGLALALELLLVLLPLELTLSRGRRVALRMSSLILLGVHARGGPLLSPGE